MERCLFGFAHALDNSRERVEGWPQQPDHKIVIVFIEPMTSQANIVAQPRAPKGAPNAAVLHQDNALFFRRQAFERAGAA